MTRLRPYGRRRLVELSWVLDADEIPRPIRPGDCGELELTTREGASPVELGYLIRNIGTLELDAWLPSTPAAHPMRFELELQPLRLGGARTYLVCPGCGRRSLKLYRPFVARDGFACRDCHHLGYRSSSQRPRSVAEWLAFVKRPRPLLPSPQAEWRRFERRRASATQAQASDRRQTPEPD